METSSDDSCCVTKTGESNSCDSVFERLFSAVSCVSLPQPSWAAHLINLAGVRDVVFIDAAVAHRTSDGSSVLFNRKALHVKSNMEVQVYILDKLIDSAAIGLNYLLSHRSMLHPNPHCLCCPAWASWMGKTIFKTSPVLLPWRIP
ncbi:hypothetical protein MRX96_016802 [Rhipicephalus microplus]